MNPIPADLLPLASALTKLLPVKPVYLVRQPDTIVLWSCTGGQPYKNVITAAEGEWVGPNRIIYRGVKVGRALELLVDPRDPLLVGQLMEEIRKKYGRDTIDHIAWVRRLLYDLDTEAL